MSTLVATEIVFHFCLFGENKKWFWLKIATSRWQQLLQQLYLVKALKSAKAQAVRMKSWNRLGLRAKLDFRLVVIKPPLNATLGFFENLIKHQNLRQSSTALFVVIPDRLCAKSGALRPLALKLSKTLRVLVRARFLFYKSNTWPQLIPDLPAQRRRRRRGEAGHGFEAKPPWEPGSGPWSGNCSQMTQKSEIRNPMYEPDRVS